MQVGTSLWYLYHKYPQKHWSAPKFKGSVKELSFFYIFSWFIQLEVTQDTWFTQSITFFVELLLVWLITWNLFVMELNRNWALQDLSTQASPPRQGGSLRRGTILLVQTWGIAKSTVVNFVPAEQFVAYFLIFLKGFGFPWFLPYL